MGNVIGLGKNIAHTSFLWSSFIPVVDEKKLRFNFGEMIENLCFIASVFYLTLSQTRLASAYDKILSRVIRVLK